jgi:hypothetical protein
MDTAPHDHQVTAPGNDSTDERIKMARACLDAGVPEAAAFHMCLIDARDSLRPDVSAVRDEIQRIREGK